MIDVANIGGIAYDKRMQTWHNQFPEIPQDNT